MAHRKHKEVIEAWLNGAQVQHKDCAGQWEDSEQDQPGFFGHMEYRIKPAEPERVYPKTQMTMDELRGITEKYAYDNLLVNMCNAALRHACDAGQIVTREEFDRAVEDRRKRDLAVAQEVVDRAWLLIQLGSSRAVREINIDHVVDSVK